MGRMVGTPTPFGLVPPQALQWIYVTRRFKRFLANLKLLPDQISDGETKHKGVVDCLNRAYWGRSSEEANRLLVGSWGKGTRVRPPRDIDILFVLPLAVYQRFQQRTGNRQSQLLQEVKDYLLLSYPTTRMRGDGQVVVVAFNSYQIEVVPAFAREGGGYLVCDANEGGQYKWVDPVAEISDLHVRDTVHNGNVLKLVQIFKQWQRHCDVPIKSFHLEAMVKTVLRTSAYGSNDEFWFDWLVRDVFAGMIGWANATFQMPVTGEVIHLGDAWLNKAKSGYARSLKACEYEQSNLNQAAGDAWQKIFGAMIPQLVT
jgi:hypothetical protein